MGQELVHVAATVCLHLAEDTRKKDSQNYMQKYKKKHKIQEIT